MHLPHGAAWLTHVCACCLLASQALQHPYLAEYHEPAEEPACASRFSFEMDFEQVALSKEGYKQLVLQEIASLHS
eukprot:COSAG01_NODE_21451_length_901_cov_2.391521_1_plen_75_part_00